MLRAFESGERKCKSKFVVIIVASLEKLAGVGSLEGFSFVSVYYSSSLIESVGKGMIRLTYVSFSSFNVLKCILLSFSR